ncbi:MAG: G-D-S-L family lipolytic protein, partial [Flavobacteriaceae bacterium]|nr:G-D-S-L family lipolytic protein [Flavobacteriaceae bacterium]
MKINTIKWLSLSLLALFFWSCDPEFDDSVEDGDFFSPGDVDFSNFVSVGNSLTAGFADNALYITGQENSFPNIMARQFRLVGGGDFEIPFMADNLGGFLVNGVQAAPNRLVLAADDQTATPLGPAVLAGTPTTEILNTLQGPFNNMGVPGAKSFHLLAPGFGDPAGLSAAPQTANPYFVRFASSPGTTVIADAVAQNPSFFSLWIGNNDILGFATSGGDGSNPITDLPTFQGAYTTLVNQLTATGAEGILANIPDVTSIPFFTTVPFNALDPNNPAFGPQIPTLNQTFGLLNQVYSFLGVPERSIVFSTNGPSALVIHDEALANLSQQITQVLIQAGVPAGQANIFGALYGQSRQANAGDLLTLTAASAIGTINQNNVAFLTGLG